MPDRMRPVLGFEKLGAQGIRYGPQREAYMRSKKNCFTSSLAEPMAMRPICVAIMTAHGCLAAIQEVNRSGVMPYPLGDPTCRDLSVAAPKAKRTNYLDVSSDEDTITDAQPPE